LLGENPKKRATTVDWCSTAEWAMRACMAPNVRDLLECHISFYLSFGETERLQGLGMQFLVIFS